MTGKYCLLGKKNENKIVEEILDIAIGSLCETIKMIQKNHPDVGIGDTQTDEAIMEVLYDKLHWKQ